MKDKKCPRVWDQHVKNVGEPLVTTLTTFLKLTHSDPGWGWHWRYRSRARLQALDEGKPEGTELQEGTEGLLCKNEKKVNNLPLAFWTVWDDAMVRAGNMVNVLFLGQILPHTPGVPQSSYLISVRCFRPGADCISCIALTFSPGKPLSP